MNLVKACISLLVLLVVITGVLFLDFAYKTFSYRPKIVPVDAIVVLTGGKGRVTEGVRLYRERAARYLVIVGADPAVKVADIYRPKMGDPSAEGVILEKNSRNTLENAIYGRQVINRLEIRSLLLITSRYHLKRATILLRNALPSQCAIYPYPVDTANLKQTWWKDGGSFTLLFSEFYKYCLFRAFFLFAPGELQHSVIQPP